MSPIRMEVLEGGAVLMEAGNECRVCGKGFFRRTTLHAVCSPRCLSREQATKDKAERADRVATKRRLAELQPRQYWLKAAEAVVNKYVRLRDRERGCVSCDRPASWGGQWHASHFRSVGAASAVRFNLWNIHKACSICNKHLSGNLSAYEPRLRDLIGDARVDWLRTQNQRVDYTVEYLKRLKAVFAKKVRRLEKRA